MSLVIRIHYILVNLNDRRLKKTILIFGGLAVAILLLFQLKQWSLFALGASEKSYLIFSGTMFFVLGIFISRYLFVQGKKRNDTLRKSSLTDKELEVLHLMSDGLSNKEIGSELFIAETTVKSHVSNILSKLDAKRRTEAIKIGKELKII